MMALITDYWAQYFAVLALCSFCFCVFWVTPRFGIPASLLLGQCCYSSLLTWVWVNNRYVNVNPYDQMALRYFSCDSIAKIMLVVVPLMLFSKDRGLMKAVGVVGASLFVVLNCLLAIWEARLGCGNNRCGGIIGNPSISMGLTVCIVATFVHSWRQQWLVIALLAIGVYLSESSIAAGLFALYALLHFWPRSLNWAMVKSYALEGVIGALAILGMMAWRSTKGLFHVSDRFMVWKHMMDHWLTPQNFLFGTGLGTYHVFSINIQKYDPIAGMSNGLYLWWNTLHNDFLQHIFECGVIGGSVLFVTYCSALIKVWRERDFQIATSIILYGLYMCVNPALHNPLPVLFGAWLFVYALRKPTKEYQA